MNLPIINYSEMDAEERKATIRERQRTGALFTHQTRKTGTETRMVYAWEEIIREGKKPTQKNIADTSGLSLRTVKAHWHSPDFVGRTKGMVQNG